MRERAAMAAGGRWWAMLALCLAGGALVSEWLGQDGNYDLINYHLYNGAALLHGWFQRDLLAAGMQSGFNPVLDAIYASLALGPLRESPRVLAGVMGLPAGVLAFLAWRLAGQCYPARPWAVLMATALAATGAAFVAEIGTTFNDIPPAALMLAGLLAMLHAGGRWRRVVLAGALFGVAAGLKLTALVYAPAACLALAALYRPRAWPWAIGLFVAGWVGGWLASDGWWALMQWRRFASPVFPLLNGVFHSPWYPPADFVDDRFRPAGLLQALIYPIYWLAWDPHAVGEIMQRAPLGAVTLVLGALVLGALAAIRRGARLPAAHRAVLIFLVAGYVSWLATSGILRYAIVLEVVAGLCIPLLLARLLQGRALLVGCIATVILVAATTRYGDWGRLPYGERVFTADTGWVKPGMLIVLTLRTPVAHMVPLMPHQKQISVIGLDFALLDARGWALHDEALRRVRTHDGPIAVITGGDAAGRFAELAEIGLDPVPTDCRPVTSTFYPRPDTVMACMTRRLEGAPMPSAFWTQAAARYRTVVQLQRSTGPLVGAAYLRAAGPAARGTRFLDWTDLLWTGVGRPHDALPPRLDPATLYVLGADYLAPMATRMDAARDVLGTVDGVSVLAPGWRTCLACTAAVEALPSVPAP